MKPGPHDVSWRTVQKAPWWRTRRRRVGIDT
jgi:hypothetical protein